MNTEIAIPPTYWNKKRLCIVDSLPEIYGSVEILNYELYRMIRVVQDMILFAEKNKIEDRGTFVKNTFKPDFDIKTLDSPNVAKIIEGNQEKKLIEICISK